MSNLSIKRTVGQSLHITTADWQLITVSITEQKGRQDKLSVEADESVTIMRDDLVGTYSNLAGVNS
jgi:sRNA-binding carbon storage regulator CsrA